jgi:hypothetical protein
VSQGKKKAAGEPAAEATGRHHNVREDIGLAVAGKRSEEQIAKPVVQADCTLVRDSLTIG